jgi:hypothetical protein
MRFRQFCHIAKPLLLSWGDDTSRIQALLFGPALRFRRRASLDDTVLIPEAHPVDNKTHATCLSDFARAVEFHRAAVNDNPDRRWRQYTSASNARLALSDIAQTDNPTAFRTARYGGTQDSVSDNAIWLD